MPNNYFQFKEFLIQQDKCAMKVTTDACLFGAYIAEIISNSKLKIKNCLDIGTGSGLLSLMLAQKTNLLFDIVEIDEASYLQTKENFKQSPWANRIKIFHEDILQFNPRNKYDCIISNPPFYENDLKSEHDSKNKAKHDTSLTLKQLLQIINDKLTEDGIFFILIPFHRTKYFEMESASFGFYLKEKILVKQTPKHDFFRSILFFSRGDTKIKTSEIIIKDEAENYTKEFIYLLKDYYLHL